VSDGAAKYTGLGDLHDRSFSGQGRSSRVSAFIGSVNYVVEIYPAQEYVDGFHTNTPLYAMIITVSIVFFTSVVFVLYDLLLNRSAVEKELRMNINTKRLFVRFISHEIRTPLNTVHIGLQLLVSEMLQYISAMRDSKETPAPVAVAEKIADWVSVIRDIEDSSDSAIVVLNDLINYDKISMGTLNPEFEVVSLWDLVCATVKPFHVQARRSGITLQVLLECEQEGLRAERGAKLDRLVVIADRVKLSQVIRNLLSNALKFSKEGSTVVVKVQWDEDGLPASNLPSGFVHDKDKSSSPPSHAITVTPELVKPVRLTRAGSLVVTVTDSGAGISKDNQLHLFREGVQFNANQLQAGQGSGLGLWISHGEEDVRRIVYIRGCDLLFLLLPGIISLHSGVLSATYEGEGLGSEFRCELPAALSPDKVPRTTAHTPRHGDADILPVNHQLSNSATMLVTTTLGMTAASPTEWTQQDSVRNVIIVDDSGPTRKVVARLLRNAGLVCTEAVDGQDCLDQVLAMTKENPVHMILMDFEMPRMNGPTATAKLRELGYKMPIIGVTGNVLAADKDYFVAHGADSVLHKPLSVEQLNAEISKIHMKRDVSFGVSVDPQEVKKGSDCGEDMV
jgi:signal transduction histidine kinase/ActR/RegA family two-component response regulator